MQKKEYIINAEGKSLGRIATEAASILMGKNRTDFSRNAHPEVTVEIQNASKVAFTEKKKEQKTYALYSGYPGGLRNVSLKDTVNKKGGFITVFRDAVNGMLPKNKLQKRMLANLKVTE